MSKPKELKGLAHGEVQKKIIEKPLKIRSDKELIGLHNRYRDENFEIYNSKKKQFLEASKKYNRLNQETLICNKRRLLDDYIDLIDFNFLEEEKEVRWRLSSKKLQEMQQNFKNSVYFSARNKVRTRNKRKFGTEKDRATNSPSKHLQIKQSTPFTIPYSPYFYTIRFIID